jgi:hypothetical protein
MDIYYVLYIILNPILSSFCVLFLDYLYLSEIIIKYYFNYIFNPTIIFLIVNTRTLVLFCQKIKKSEVM